MKAEKQRMALAEFSGWQWWTHNTAGGYAWFLRGPQPDGWFVSARPEHYLDLDWHELPDYLNDLDAIHAVEQEWLAGASVNQTNQWLDNLYRAVGLNPDGSGKRAPASVIQLSKAICAPASARAEALLRTIGKWEKK